MTVETGNPSLNTRGSAVRSGAATSISSLTVSGAAAIAGAYLAHKFGRNARTDGFLAAYSVYFVIVLTAQASRLVIVPDLTRASMEQRLPAEFVSFASALLTIAIPATVLTIVFSEPIANVLTGRLPQESSSIASSAIVWLVPAAFAQMLAALAASALAAGDSYVVAAVGYASGAVTGLVVFVALADAHGMVALAWGLALNGAIAAALPLAELTRSGRLRGELGGGAAVWVRLRKLVYASAVPLALQGMYVVALRGASGLGEGNQTTLTYAYLFGSMLVAATATALALVSSGPLTRRAVDADGASRHVLHAIWLCLVLVGAAAGVFALVGGRVVGFVLGDAYSGHVGTDLGHLVIYLSPWVVAAVAFWVTFPLLFVLETPSGLLPLAVAAFAADIGLSFALRALFDLKGLALALGASTLLVVAALMAFVSMRMLKLTMTKLVKTALLVGGITFSSFGLPELVTGGLPAAVAGLALYAGTLAVLRPRGLVDAWRYVRVLHQ
jgi:peptidoglycan biosynthesis protein MviN/MurJ (putative lipid II flippase)